MPTIKNRTKNLLVFSSEKHGTVAIPQGAAKHVPDELWASYGERDSVQAMVAERRILVIHGDAPASTEQVSSSSVAPSSGGDEGGGWSTMHYRTAQKLIKAEDSVSTLEKLLENETRPKFVEMLSTRIEELEGS